MSLLQRLSLDQLFLETESVKKEVQQRLIHVGVHCEQNVFVVEGLLQASHHPHSVGFDLHLLIVENERLPQFLTTLRIQQKFLNLLNSNQTLVLSEGHDLVVIKGVSHLLNLVSLHDLDISRAPRLTSFFFFQLQLLLFNLLLRVLESGLHQLVLVYEFRVRVLQLLNLLDHFFVLADLTEVAAVSFC